MNGWAEEPVLPGVVYVWESHQWVSLLGCSHSLSSCALWLLLTELRTSPDFSPAAPLSIKGSRFKQTVVVVILEPGVVLRQWKSFFSRQGEYRLWLEQSLLRWLRWIVSSYSPGSRSNRSVSVEDTVHEGEWFKSLRHAAGVGTVFIWQYIYSVPRLYIHWDMLIEIERWSLAGYTRN